MEIKFFTMHDSIRSGFIDLGNDSKKSQLRFTLSTIFKFLIFSVGNNHYLLFSIDPGNLLKNLKL